MSGENSAAKVLPIESDLTDWMVADGEHHNAEDVRRLALAPPAPARRFRLLTDVDLEAYPQPVPVIAGVLFADSLAALIGKYGTYKTFILLEMAFCIAIGCEWYGQRVRQGPVIYIYSEGVSGAGARLAALKHAYGFPDSVPIFFLPTSVLLTDPVQVRDLLAAIAELDIAPVTVIVDTIARNMGGSENDVETMGTFIRGCDKIREAFGCLVLLAHHAGWANDRSRGSTALPGALSTEITVERDGETVTLKCTKQKDAPEFSPITLEAMPTAGSITFMEVVLGRAELTKNERAALTEVQTAPGRRSKSWREASGLAQGSFNNVLKRLKALAYVKLAGDFYVATDAGRMALGTKDNSRTTEGQTQRAGEGQHTLVCKDQSVVLDHSVPAVLDRGEAWEEPEL